MQKRPDDRATVRSRRTQPALPGATSPTAPIVARPSRYAATLQPVRRRYSARRAVLRLLLLGAILELLLLALYPLLAGPASDPVQRALLSAFPWQPRLYWTTALPGLAHLTSSISWLDPASAAGMANLSLLLLALASAVALLAARVGARVVREIHGRLPRPDERSLFWTIMLVTLLVALTMLCAPAVSGAMSQEMLLYDFYGRVVVAFHANPYAISSSTLPSGAMQIIASLPQAARSSSGAPLLPSGPIGVDLSILVTLLARGASALPGLRLIGLLAHMINATLIWAILAQVKPEARISATLLYAWNPIVLLLGVAQMHLMIIVVFCVLLAVFFLLRNALWPSWIFALLAALVDPSCLLLLPLFLRMMVRKARMQQTQRRQQVRLRFSWWLSLLVLSALIVVLACAPYWQGGGRAGLEASVLQVFWQGQAINSLDAALLNLPIQLPAALLWPLLPQHWMVVVLIIVGGFLLFSLWLVDTLELLLLCVTWLTLLVLTLQPVCWPWLTLLPLALALCSANRSAVLLAVLLTLGAALAYYCWLWLPVWMGQGLAAIGLPLVLWGWTLFFTSTWQMIRANQQSPPENKKRLSRPPWLTRPSWPSRPGRRG